MSTDNQHPSAWRPLIDDWIEREGHLRPHLPVRGESVRVRDAVEVGDNAYVLLSFDVDSPWPAEENLSGGAETNAHTAVIQAERVRQPWHERDSTRSRTAWRTSDGTITIHEHLLGPTRAFSGQAPSGASKVTLSFDEGDAIDATVVEGWFLAVVPEGRRAKGVAVDGNDTTELEPAEIVGNTFSDLSFATETADAMYFSPLDLRSVVSLVQWHRSGDIVAVATCVEQYDDGGMLRLRIDGIRADDDTFVTWPRILLHVDGEELPSAVCGEYSLADTISLDIGFRPWLPAGARELVARIEGARGAEGDVAPIVLTIQLP